ncbi:MAG TPA: glucose-6-phosphate dehydrogenase assembly protein OpcA [Candidatus Dormibacteraeota bacterium]
MIRAQPRHPDQVRSADWHERGVTLGEVLSEVTSMHAKLARAEAADDAMPHPRNCCLNLVAISDDDEETRLAEQVGQALASHHPLRQLLVELEPSHDVDRLDAWLHTEAHQTSDGMPIQFERIRLRVTGAGTQEIDSLVAPLLVPEVSTCLWWLGNPPVSNDAFLRLLELSDLLAVDSATFERPFLVTLELAGLAVAVGRQVPINDFHWARLQPWRELLAQFFQPGERRGFLRGLNAVGIDYAGEGRGNRVAAALLVGWLASALEWRLQRAAAGRGGAVGAMYKDAQGRSVEVHLRSVPAAALAAGELAAIRVESAAGSRVAAYAAERSADDHERVQVRIGIGESETLTERLPLQTPAPVELLVEMLNQRPDPVYMRSLGAAADLLKAFR